MKIKGKAIRRMLSIACLLVAVALPLSGFQKIVSGQSTPTISNNDVTPYFYNTNNNYIIGLDPDFMRLKDENSAVTKI